MIVNSINNSIILAKTTKESLITKCGRKEILKEDSKMFQKLWLFMFSYKTITLNFTLLAKNQLAKHPCVNRNS